MVKVTNLHLTFSAAKRWIFLLFFIVSCAQPTHSDLSKSTSCLSRIGATQLRQIVKDVVSAKPATRLKLVDGLRYMADQEPPGQNLSYDRLIRYLTDITDSELKPINGAHLQFSSLEHAEVIAFKKPIPKIGTNLWNAIQEPVWSDYPIPKHLMVTNYPVFRGERILLRGLGMDEFPLAPESKVWDKLNTLFSIGTISFDRRLQDIWHQDVFKHTADSQGSPYLGSTREITIAKKFGKKPLTDWSAVIEARVDGIDVNKTGRYFERFDFLEAGKSMIPIEREIAVNYGIKPDRIRGVWFYEVDGLVYFVPNPNYDTLQDTEPTNY